MKDRVAALIAREEHVLGTDVLNRFPIAKYVTWFSDPVTEGNYALFPGTLSPWMASVEADLGEAGLSAIHRLATAQLIGGGLSRLSSEGLAPTVQKAWLEWVEGIAARLEEEPQMHLDANDDLFRKDITICALRMLPTRGPCHVEVGFLARRFLISGGVLQAQRALRCLLLDLRLERKRLYSLHVDDRVVYRTFGEEGWNRTYEDVAAMMRRHPDIRALHAASWFWDPRVGEISPRMAYLVDVPQRKGARFFRLGTDETAMKNALTNQKRRRLYEVGEYTPINYLMVWPRKALLLAYPEGG